MVIMLVLEATDIKKETILAYYQQWRNNKTSIFNSFFLAWYDKNNNSLFLSVVIFMGN